jgi:hypothetical protein
VVAAAVADADLVVAVVALVADASVAVQPSQQLLLPLQLVAVVLLTRLFQLAFGFQTAFSSRFLTR